jgi:hypothetical protein
MAQKIIPLIMCGGAGTRLWPASREVRPKQFLPLYGARSTFQDTLVPVSDASLFDRPIVITNAAYRFMVLEQLRRSASRRTSCWSQYAGSPVRRLPPVRPSRRRATETRSCSRSPPITLSVIRLPLSRPAARVWSQRRRDES